MLAFNIFQQAAAFHPSFGWYVMLSSWHLSSSFTWNFPKSRHIWLGDLSIPWTAPNWRKQTPHGTRAAIKGAKRGEDQFSLHLNHQTRINTQFFHSWTISGDKWTPIITSPIFFQKIPALKPKQQNLRVHSFSPTCWSDQGLSFHLHEFQSWDPLALLSTSRVHALHLSLPIDRNFLPKTFENAAGFFVRSDKW